MITAVATNHNPYDLVNPSLRATNSFVVVVVREVNMAPVLPVIAQQTVNELELLVVTNTATEPNIHSVTVGYGLLSAPVGMSIDSSGIITWTPAQEQSPGTNLVTTVVTNNNPYDLVHPSLRATNSFVVVVREVNMAPVLPVIAEQVVNEGKLLVVTNTATEPNIHSVTVGYGLIEAPAGMSIDGNGIITWTPAQSQSPSTNLVTTVVTNNNPYDLVNPELRATNSFVVVVVREVNRRRSCRSLPSRWSTSGELLVVTNTATEPNIHSVTVGYGLMEAPAGMSIEATGLSPGPRPRARARAPT